MGRPEKPVISSHKDVTETAHSAFPQVGAGAVQQVADPYANEPERHPALVVRTQKPFNAETPGALLAGAALTPVDLFYVRNHLPVPHIDAATHSVRPLTRYTAVVKCRFTIWCSSL